MNAPRRKSRLVGLKKILFPMQKARDFMDTSGPARVMFDPAARTASGQKGQDLVDFLKQASLTADLGPGDRRRLARIVHEREYRDGEIIFDQGTPAATLYILRCGMVQIMRKKRDGEEIPLAMLEPPASFEELAAVGGEVVHWASARAHGSVSAVAIGRSDLDALSRNFPSLANKILMKLSRVVAAQMQMLLEAEYFNEEMEP
ncbi:MAG: cyclic nucleotide-binding domain-containing protein [Thermodesulfobacteriota bacterium]